MGRSISEIMREGQAKSLEQIELVQKKMDGTITEDEKVRLAMLEGNLLSLVREAQAQGVGTGFAGGVISDEDEAPYEDEDEDDEPWGDDEDEDDEGDYRAPTHFGFGF